MRRCVNVVVDRLAKHGATFKFVEIWSSPLLLLENDLNFDVLALGQSHFDYSIFALVYQKKKGC